MCENTAVDKKLDKIAELTHKLDTIAEQLTDLVFSYYSENWDEIVKTVEKVTGAKVLTTHIDMESEASFVLNIYIDKALNYDKTEDVAKVAIMESVIEEELGFAKCDVRSRFPITVSIIGKDY